MKPLLTALVFLLGCSSSPVDLSPSPDRERVLSAAREVMRQARYATFITMSADGQPQARIVDPTELDAELLVWIGTNPATRKVAQLRRNPRATLHYFDRETEAQLTLLGTATLVSDPAEKLRHWQERWAPFYPDGARSEEFILIRFAPHTLEIVSAPHKLLNDAQDWRPVILRLDASRE